MESERTCGCFFCSVARLLRFLASCGIHTQKDLDERVRAWKAEAKRG